MYGFFIELSPRIQLEQILKWMISCWRAAVWDWIFIKTLLPLKPSFMRYCERHSFRRENAVQFFQLLFSVSDELFTQWRYIYATQILCTSNVEKTVCEVRPLSPNKPFGTVKKIEESTYYASEWRFQCASIMQFSRQRTDCCSLVPVLMRCNNFVLTSRYAPLQHKSRMRYRLLYSDFSRAHSELWKAVLLLIIAW